MGVKMFFGLLLLLIGASILINVFFKVDIPIFRILVGLLIIYFGVKVLVGPRFKITHSSQRENVAVFTSKHFEGKDIEDADYSIVFSEGTIDLRNVDESKFDNVVEINAVFANATVWVPENLPVVLKTTSVASQINTPEDFSGFGSEEGTLNRDKVLRIKVNAIFAAVKILRMGGTSGSKPESNF